MADQQPMQQDPVKALLVEFGTRLNEIEEKQRLIRDRVLLIGDNLISAKEDYEKQDLDLKKKLNEIDLEIKSLKRLSRRIVDEIGNLAKRSELEILERQMKMFQPLEFARIEDVKRIVQEELENIKS